MTRTEADPDVSIVIPLRDEEDNVVPLHEELSAVMSPLSLTRAQDCASAARDSITPMRFFASPARASSGNCCAPVSSTVSIRAIPSGPWPKWCMRAFNMLMSPI